MEINDRAVPGKSENEVMENHLARYEFAKSLVKDKIAYSIACGIGFGEYILAKEGGAKKVVGLDYSEEAINYANKHYKAPNLSFLRGDALASGISDDSVDILISFETIEHIDDDKKLLREFRRILKPGGMLIISTPNKAYSFKSLLSFRPINPAHIREYKKKRFEDLLAANFTNIKFYGQKIILKRSLFLLPKYFFYKITGKLADIEKRDYKIVPYPKEKDRETCFFVAVCLKSEN